MKEGRREGRAGQGWGGKTGGVGGWGDSTAGPDRDSALRERLKYYNGGGGDVQTTAGRTASSTGRVVSGIGGTEGNEPMPKGLMAGPGRGRA